MLPPPPECFSWRRNYRGHKICVTGYPRSTRKANIEEVLSDYSARVLSITPEVTILQCPTYNDAFKAVAMSGDIVLHGAPLTIQWLKDTQHAGEGSNNNRNNHNNQNNNSRRNNRNRQKNNNRRFTRTERKSVPIPPEDLDLSGDFYSQMDSVMSSVRLSYDQVSKLGQLYEDLQDTLRTVWPECIATPFGSVTTGLATKTSDADCFLAIPMDPSRETDASFVNKAKKALFQKPHLFAETLAIPKAKTPIVKTFHIPTDTSCDVSFQTPLGVQNSTLIAFLLHVDFRLIPVAVVLKYWAKVHGLSGMGRLSNYALTMLLIFYLQQKPNPIIPSVAWLRDNATESMVVDGWETAFMNDLNRWPVVDNNATIAELLGGFFKFYASFDFETYVVSPFLGEPIKKECFIENEDLPKEFELYVENVRSGHCLPLLHNRSFCVQDPFKQCHNVASAISTRLAAEIQAYFCYAAEQYDADKDNDCNDFLKFILLNKPNLESKKKQVKTIRIQVNAMTLDKIQKQIPDKWIEGTHRAILTIFEEILKFELLPMDASGDCNENRFVEKYRAQVRHVLWRRSKCQLPDLHKCNGFVNKQVRISEELLKMEKTEAPKNGDLMALTLSLSTMQRPRCVIMLRYDAGNLNNFQELQSFLYSNCAHWLHYIQEERCHPDYVFPDRYNMETPEASETSDEEEPSDEEEWDDVDEQQLSEAAGTSAPAQASSGHMPESQLYQDSDSDFDD